MVWVGGRTSIRVSQKVIVTHFFVENVWWCRVGETILVEGIKLQGKGRRHFDCI